MATENNAVVRVRTSGAPDTDPWPRLELSDSEIMPLIGFNDCSVLYIAKNKPQRHCWSLGTQKPYIVVLPAGKSEAHLKAAQGLLW